MTMVGTMSELSQLSQRLDDSATMHREQLAEVHQRLNHLDGCVDDCKEGIADTKVGLSEIKGLIRAFGAILALLGTIIALLNHIK